MGRRSRKRSGGWGAPAPTSPRPRPRRALRRRRRRAARGAGARAARAWTRRRARPGTPSRSPSCASWRAWSAWASGALGSGGRRGVLLGLGFALVGLASLEVALREHLAGYRSHSALLAFAGALAVIVPIALLTGMRAPLAGALVAAVFAVALPALRALFRRRSGGFGFRA